MKGIQLLLASSALLWAADAGAQDWRTMVVEQLATAAPTIHGAGLGRDAAVLNGNEVFGLLADDATSFVELRLEEGAEYLIAAACDNDCSDLDLRIFDEDLDLLDKDVEEDDFPVLRFTASRPGQYMLAVDMAACSEKLCYYGFRVYRD